MGLLKVYLLSSLLFICLPLVLSQDNTGTIIRSPNNNGLAIWYPGEVISLECLLAGDGDVGFLWFKRNYKNETEFTKLKDDGKHIRIYKSKLVIHNAQTSDIADYKCACYSIKFNLTQRAIINLRPKHNMSDIGIQLEHLGESSIFIEGQRVEMTCGPTNDDIEVESTWYRAVDRDIYYEDTDTLHDVEPTMVANESHRVYVIKDPLRPYTRKLIFDPIRPEDSLYYRCHVKNSLNMTEIKVVRLKVRPYYAIIIPALAILLEALLIVSVIYFTTFRSKLRLSAQKETNDYKCIATLSFSPRKSSAGLESKLLDPHKKKMYDQNVYK